MRDWFKIKYIFKSTKNGFLCKIDVMFCRVLNWDLMRLDEPTGTSTKAGNNSRPPGNDSQARLKHHRTSTVPSSNSTLDFTDLA